MPRTARACHLDSFSRKKLLLAGGVVGVRAGGAGHVGIDAVHICGGLQGKRRTFQVNVTWLPVKAMFSETGQTRHITQREHRPVIPA